MKYDPATNTPANKQQTFVIIKPDGVQRGLIGKIISRFEDTGLKMVASKMIMADEVRLTTHYGKPDSWCLEKGEKVVAKLIENNLPVTKEAIEYGKDIVRALIKYMSCSPVLCMVWEGNEAVAVVRKIVGSTEPITSNVGTIRGDYAPDSYNIANIGGRAVRNLIHCTEFPHETEGEINIWFAPEEIIPYISVHDRILYDINLDGLVE